jgi:hypothetical protein
MPQYSNILDLLAEGARETNPIYREKMKAQQEQKNALQLRQTTTPYEDFQMQQQVQNHADLLRQQQLANQEHVEDRVATGKLKRVDVNGNALEPELYRDEPTPVPTSQQSPAQKAVAAPAATGPGDAATNGAGGGANGELNPYEAFLSGGQGALTPTAASASAAPSGGIGDSGGGPSASPLASILPQGPLTGGVGGQPPGNASANTTASRASSAQAGPLAQISQGSTTPSETGAGQTGHDSGVLPAAQAAAAQQTGFKPMEVNGNFYSATTPEEENTFNLKQARAAARRDQQTKLDALDTFQRSATVDPATAEFLKNNPDYVGATKAQILTGVKPQPTSQGMMAINLADAIEKGDQPKIDALTKAMAATHPTRGGEQDLGGFMHSGLDQNGLDSLAVAFNKTGNMPSLGMGNPALRRAIFQRAADLDQGNDLALARAGYQADTVSLTNLQKGYDAMSAFEDTGNKNLKLFLQQAKTLADNNADLGIPLLNTPLRDIQKALGEKDIPGYQTARQAAIGEISRVLQNPNLVGVMPEGARKEIAGFVPENATYGQLLEVAKILTTDMQNRKDAYEAQIAQVKDRIKNPKGSTPSVSQPNPATNTPAAPPPTGQLKPLTRAVRDQFIKKHTNNGVVDRNGALSEASQAGYDTTKVVE